SHVHGVVRRVVIQSDVLNVPAGDEAGTGHPCRLGDMRGVVLVKTVRDDDNARVGLRIKISRYLAGKSDWVRRNGSGANQRGKYQARAEHCSAYHDEAPSSVSSLTPFCPPSGGRGFAGADHATPVA